MKFPALSLRIWSHLAVNLVTKLCQYLVKAGECWTLPWVITFQVFDYLWNVCQYWLWIHWLVEWLEKVSFIRYVQRRWNLTSTVKHYFLCGRSISLIVLRKYNISIILMQFVILQLYKKRTKMNLFYAHLKRDIVNNHVLFRSGSVLLWFCSVLIQFHSGSVPFWFSAVLVQFRSGSIPFLFCSSLLLFRSGSVSFRFYSNLVLFCSASAPFWFCSVMILFRSDSLTFWLCPVLVLFSSGSLPFWFYSILVLFRSDFVPL